MYNCQTCNKQLKFIENYDTMVAPEDNEAGEIYGCINCNKTYKVVVNDGTAFCIRIPDRKLEEVTLSLEAYRQNIADRPRREIRRKKGLL